VSSGSGSVSVLSSLLPQVKYQVKVQLFITSEVVLLSDKSKVLIGSVIYLIEVKCQVEVLGYN
jgi:hypothetical protein